MFSTQREIGRYSTTAKKCSKKRATRAKLLAGSISDITIIILVINGEGGYVGCYVKV